LERTRKSVPTWWFSPDSQKVILKVGKPGAFSRLVRAAG
jgi:hypothetical protein